MVTVTADSFPIGTTIACQASKKALDIDPSNPTANMAMVEFFLQSGDTSRYLNALMTIFENPQQSISSKLKTLEPLATSLLGGQYENHEQSILDLSLSLTQTHLGDPNANLIRGELLFYKKQYAQALKHYQTSIKSIKNNIRLWQHLLECFYQLDAKTDLQKMSAEMIELYPSQASSFYYHGIGLYQQKDYKNAEKELQQAVDIALADIDIQSNALRYLAKVYSATNLFEKSDKTFEESMLVHPNNAATIHDYAYSLTKRGQKLDKATALIKDILKKEPKNIKYQTTNGFILYKQAKYSLAEQTIGKALQQGGSEVPETLERYGDVQFKLGKEREAVTYWQKALDKGSDSSILQRKISTKQLYE